MIINLKLAIFTKKGFGKIVHKRRWFFEKFSEKMNSILKQYSRFYGSSLLSNEAFDRLFVFMSKYTKT